jgi:hypothetical protein
MKKIFNVYKHEKKKAIIRGNFNVDSFSIIKSSSKPMKLFPMITYSMHFNERIKYSPNFVISLSQIKST